MDVEFNLVVHYLLCRVKWMNCWELSLHSAGNFTDHLLDHVHLSSFIKCHSSLLQHMSLGRQRDSYEIISALSSLWYEIMAVLPCLLNCGFYVEAVNSGDAFSDINPSCSRSQKRHIKSLTPSITADLVYIRISDLKLKGLVFPHQWSPWAIHCPTYPWLPAFPHLSAACLQRKVK